MSWWNSVDAVNTASSTARWLGAIIGVIVLILGHRASTLQARAKAAEKNANTKREAEFARLQAQVNPSVKEQIKAVINDISPEIIKKLEGLSNGEGKIMNCSGEVSKQNLDRLKKISNTAEGAAYVTELNEGTKMSMTTSRDVVFEISFKLHRSLLE